MNSLLFEFAFYDRKNIPRNNLLTIIEEEIAVESKQRKWTCKYEIVEVHFPILQVDGSLCYRFRVIEKADLDVQNCLMLGAIKT